MPNVRLDLTGDTRRLEPDEVVSLLAYLPELDAMLRENDVFLSRDGQLHVFTNFQENCPVPQRIEPDTTGRRIKQKISGVVSLLPK
jgi:hypothetical protein